jgi:predicted RNase H-like HicB family nuclease
MSTYRVEARRVGGWWALEVPELPGVFSQVRRLDAAEEAAREAIALMLGVDADTVSVDVDASV